MSLLNSQGTAIAGVPAGESVLYRVSRRMEPTTSSSPAMTP